jgi:hypothetical protein
MQTGLATLRSFTGLEIQMKNSLGQLCVLSAAIVLATGCGPRTPSGTYESVPPKEAGATGVQASPAKIELKEGKISVYMAGSLALQGTYTITNGLIVVRPSGQGANREFGIAIQKDGSLSAMQRTFVRK